MASVAFVVESTGGEDIEWRNRKRDVVEIAKSFVENTTDLGVFESGEELGMYI